MKRGKGLQEYLLLIGCVVASLIAPTKVVDRLRVVAVSAIAPCWQTLSFGKHGLIYFLTIPVHGTRGNDEEQQRLKQENHLLRSHINGVKEWLLSEERLAEDVNRLQIFQQSADKAFFQRRSKELSRSLSRQLQALPARVIFRQPEAWSSSVWLNVGERENRALGKQVVAKNSPVLVGMDVIGVVEEVLPTKCRVRLITDTALVPSVRALRGGSQNRFLAKHTDALLSALQLRDELSASPEEKNQLFHALTRLKSRLNEAIPDDYLAKGELYGSGHPLWRSRGQVLKGVGFNYDFSDEEGGGRDLRSTEHVPLLRPGDLLVTTGFDGVFPAGLHVATVSKIAPLREGATSYEIEATVTAGNLDDLSQVTVLPPL
jgi:rod shape-determining protein MreC